MQELFGSGGKLRGDVFEEPRASRGLPNTAVRATRLRADERVIVHQHGLLAHERCDVGDALETRPDRVGVIGVNDVRRLRYYPPVLRSPHHQEARGVAR